MKPSVFIVGGHDRPALFRCDVTRNTLRVHFGLETVIEGWTPHDSYPAVGALILTAEDPRPVVGANADVYTFDEALELERQARASDTPRLYVGRGYVERNPDGYLTDEQLDEIRNDDSEQPSRPDHSAAGMLLSARDAIADRAASRDCPDGERSMGRCVRAFNAITGHSLTEVDGWNFMELLKLARATAGRFHADDHIDRAAYAALAGEAAAREARAA